MSEMIPKPNTVPAEKAPEPVGEAVSEVDGLSYIVELAPSVPTLEALSVALGAEISAAGDYSVLMDVIEAAIAKHGHQTVRHDLEVKL